MPKQQQMFFTIPQAQSTTTKIYLKDVLFPPQENYGAFVTSNDKLYPPWFFEKITKENLSSKIRLHGHTHPSFSTNPSGTDIHQFTEMMHQVDDFMIQLILSNYGKPHCALWTRAKDGSILLVKINVIWQYEEKINKMLAKVTQKVDPKRKPYSNPYKSKINRKKKKKIKHTKSPKANQIALFDLMMNNQNKKGVS